MIRRRSKKPLRVQKYQLATALTESLEKQGRTMMDLAVSIETTYEHIRKMCHGLAFPSKDKLVTICEELDLDLAEMKQLLIADRVQRTYGEIPEALTGRHPRFAQIERLLPKITEEQFHIILGQLEEWDRQNRERSEAVESEAAHGK